MIDLNSFHLNVSLPADAKLKDIRENCIEIKLKVAQNSFQYFPRRSVWWVIITTLYQLMLQSWYQKTAQSLVNTMVLFLWHNRLP